MKMKIKMKIISLNEIIELCICIIKIIFGMQ